ncbi:MAG: hypothetical protein V1676_00565 [Candidatus Diapherotrites archaeon]
MGIITVFLVVLIAALGIGNGLLYITKPNGRGGQDDENGFSLVMVKEPNAAELAKLGSRYNALHQKVEMAHSRISALESALSGARAGTSSGAGANANAFSGNGNGLEEKIRKLDHFRANAAVEMKAIKEILIELQNRGMTVKAKKFVPRRATEKREEQDMHKIIYRSASPAKKKGKKK